MTRGTSSITAQLKLGTFALLLALPGCSKRDVTPKLELRLTISRQQWYVGEYPWYLLQVKNVGTVPATIEDPAWLWQSKLHRDSEGKAHTRFQVIGPDGQKASASGSQSIHGAWNFWTNECRDDRCKSGRPIILKPGETFTATPSIVRPVSQPDDSTDAYDSRAGPELPSHLPPKRVEQLRTQFKDMAEDIGLMGNGLFTTNARKALAAAPKGYRILEGYGIHESGIYRIQVIYDERCRFGPPPKVDLNLLSQDARESHERFRRKMARLDIRDAEFRSKWRREMDESCKRKVYAESNVVQIEVLKAPPGNEGPAQHFQLPSPAQMKRAHKKLAEAAERATP